MLKTKPVLAKTTKENRYHLEHLTFYNQGCKFLRIDEFDMAIECFEEALIRQPNFSEAWNNKGVALIMLDRQDEALSIFREALTFNLTKDPYIWYHLGLLCEHPVGSLECLDQALSLDKEFFPALIIRAKRYFGLYLYEDALENYFRALELRPNDYMIYILIAQVYVEQGEKSKYIQAMTKALHLVPSDEQEIKDRIKEKIQEI